MVRIECDFNRSPVFRNDRFSSRLCCKTVFLAALEAFPETRGCVKGLVYQFQDALLVTQMAEFGPERWMADESIHANVFNRNIIQPTTWSMATIAWKCPVLLKVIGAPVLYFSPACHGIHLHLHVFIISTRLASHARHVSADRVSRVQ